MDYTKALCQTEGCRAYIQSIPCLDYQLSFTRNCSLCRIENFPTFRLGCAWTATSYSAISQVFAERNSNPSHVREKQTIVIFFFVWLERTRSPTKKACLLIDSGGRQRKDFFFRQQPFFFSPKTMTDNVLEFFEVNSCVGSRYFFTVDDFGL